MNDTKLEAHIWPVNSIVDYPYDGLVVPWSLDPHLVDLSKISRERPRCADQSNLNSFLFGRGSSQPVIDTYKSSTEPVIATCKSSTKPVIATYKSSTEPVIATYKSSTEPVIATYKSSTEPVIATDKSSSQPVIATCKSSTEPVLHVKKKFSLQPPTKRLSSNYDGGPKHEMDVQIPCHGEVITLPRSDQSH
ncbi:hypothetical protein Bpfe_022459 [Biomphalaria pfeifferi]|uniref:Uncharacterized protein n=1 Tax=Biomphalaria pfeifferi TaxID=112525 RepID=A0AAD8F308_BIOPF|nr:hypothetical protein Bpfe_022459 [Biomphalaria pfeifferi]